MIAAVSRIGSNLFMGQNVQFNDSKRCAKLLRQPLGIVELKLRPESRLDKIGTHICSGIDSSPEKIGGVHTPGKANSGFGIGRKKIS